MVALYKQIYCQVPLHNYFQAVGVPPEREYGEFVSTKQICGLTVHVWSVKSPFMDVLVVL